MENLIIAGGVSANRGIRDSFEQLCRENNIFYPYHHLNIVQIMQL